MEDWDKIVEDFHRDGIKSADKDQNLEIETDLARGIHSHEGQVNVIDLTVNQVPEGLERDREEQSQRKLEEHQECSNVEDCLLYGFKSLDFSSFFVDHGLDIVNCH